MPCTVANVRTYRGSMNDAVYVGRPSLYGNPFKIGQWTREGTPQTRQQVIALFEHWWLSDDRAALRGQAAGVLKDKVLLCWCAPQSCHAEIIAKTVNDYWEARERNAATL